MTLLEYNSRKLAAYYRKHHEDAKRYGHQYTGIWRGYRASIFKQWIGQGKRILDLGCRDGTLTRFYMQGNQVIGVDIDPRALSICSEQLGIQTLWCDVNKPLPFGPSSFDCVVAGEIIEHLFYPEIFLEEVARVLRPYGIFIGSTPNTFRLKNRWKFLIGEEYNDKTHLHRFSFQGIKKLLEKHFVDVITLPCGGYLFGGGRTGIIPINPRTPKFIGKLFAKSILWNAKILKK